MKTVLVTGASGFLGRHAALEFSRSGSRVLGIGRHPWEEREWRAWGLSAWLCADASPDALSYFAVEPDVLVHCAGSGSVGFSFQAPVVDFESTVGTLLSALEFIRLHAPAARLVYPSSAAVYGRAESLPIHEASPLRPASPYGAHKLIAEHLCRSYAQHFGVKVAMVRFFSLYGPELRKQLLWDACGRFSRGEAGFLGTGEEIRDWLHAADAAKLVRAAAERADHGCRVMNGASGRGTSVREVLTCLREAFPGAPPLSFSAESKAGDPSAYLGDCTEALSLGWTPSVLLEDGLRDYARWFQHQHR